jgi:hypothetical protein
MNLDSNHVYGNRFIKVGWRGFNPALITNFSRSDDGDLYIWFGIGQESDMWLRNEDADLVWKYLTANSDELTVPKYIFCSYEDCDQTVPNKGDYCEFHVNMLSAEKQEELAF